MKRTDKKIKVGQQRYDERKSAILIAKRERLRTELRNRFAILQGSKDEEDVDIMWHEFKTAYNGTAGVALGKKKRNEGCKSVGKESERVGRIKYNDDYRKKRRVEAEDVQVEGRIQKNLTKK